MIKAAVIGVGHMGYNHVRVYAEMEAIKLVAVADTDITAARRAARNDRLNFYTDYRRMLDRETPDVVSLAVPTVRHAEVAREVISRGVSLLIEKPLASTPAQGRYLLQMAERHGVKLMVGHIERFNPAIIEIKRHLDMQELGRVFQVHARRLSPFPDRIQDVGVVLDLATHDIDVMRYLLGSEVERVYAEIEGKAYGSCEDLLSGLLRFRNGVIGVLDVNWLTPTKVRQLAVLGEGGMYLADYLTQDVYWYKNSRVAETCDTSSLFRGVSEGDMVKVHFQKKEPLRAELESFVGAVLEDREPPISGSDGLAALELVQRLIESSRRQAAINCGWNWSKDAEIRRQERVDYRWSWVHR
ncbi:MAG TPA: Gfo/Idh/MocA family oxidoreductase [Candidatus Binatia bacterium]|nr:Gfo/Idh/MocA family oxidoreductase [Candidatus Binatia bacterium]